MPEMLSTAAELDRLPTDQDLGRLQFTTLLYYLQCTNPDNGLVRDKTEPNAPASIAAIGMALATHPRGCRTRRPHPRICGKDHP